MYNWKTTPRDNVFLKIPKGAPLQDGWPMDPITTETITSQCGLTMFWLFSVISLQHFRLQNKARVYLLKCNLCIFGHCKVTSRPLRRSFWVLNEFPHDGVGVLSSQQCSIQKRAFHHHYPVPCPLGNFILYLYSRYLNKYSTTFITRFINFALVKNKVESMGILRCYLIPCTSVITLIWH